MEFPQEQGLSMNPGDYLSEYALPHQGKNPRKKNLPKRTSLTAVLKAPIDA